MRRPSLLLAIGAALLVAAPALAAGKWSGESYLAEGLHEATGPSVAVAPNGAAVAGWQQNQGQFGNVDAFLTARAPGTGAFATGGTRQQVDSAKAHDEGDMHATTAVNDAGKAVVAWRQATFNGDFRIQAVVRAAGASTFGAVQTLTAEGEEASVPTVAMNASGAAVLVWRRHETATKSWQVQGAALSNAGTTFTALDGGGNISADPDDGSDDFLSPEVSVAIAPSGTAIVAWHARTAVSLGSAYWARKGPTDSAFAAGHDLGTGTWQPDVAAGGGGTLALTWIAGSGGSTATVSLARSATGDFGSGTPVVSTPDSIVENRVGVDAAGNAIVAVAALTTSGTQPRVGVTTCPPASSCPTPSWLTSEERRVEGIDLAVNDAGDAVAAWSRSNGTHELVEASLHAHGKGWDPPVFVSRTDQDAHVPTVGIDGSGHATMAWTAANVALFAVRQATGAVDGASTPTPTPTATPTPPGPSGGGGSPPPPSPPPPAADRAVAASAKLAKKTKATKAGRFSGPKITCSETAGACRVAITFTTKKKRKRIVAARAKATIKAGKSATPSVKLLKAAKSLLAKQHKLALTGTVRVTDAAGNTRSFAVKTRLTARR